jgi:cytochrome P450 PksS
MRADFVSQAYFRDPAAEIAKLRSAGPVVEVQFPMIGKVWTTTTQDLADRVLKDGDTFTIRTGIGGVAGLQWWMPRILGTLANHMLSMDEPDHRRLRDIVDEAFRRRAVLEMEPRILAIADEFAGELFAEGSPADLVDRYAKSLFRRWPKLELAVDESQIKWRRRPGLKAIEHLPVAIAR